MNYNTLRIFALNMCLFAGHAYGMDTELEQLTSQKEDTLELLKEMPTVKKDTFEIEHAQQTRNHILDTQIKKRKLCNVIYAMMTLGMMGVDIANSYWDEKGLLKQVAGNRESGNTFWTLHSCECPNKTAECKIRLEGSPANLCLPRLDSYLLYGANDSMTVWRFYYGFMNLYHLYQVQQALNTRSIIADNKTYNEKNKSHDWYATQGISSGVIGIIAVVAAIVNGITDYPRTVAIWGANAAIDALGSLNWHENENACESVIAFNEAKVEEVKLEDEKE